VERNSVSSKRGFRSTLHLDVNSLRVSTISSNVFWCLKFVASEFSLLCPFFSFSPVQLVDDNGEYRREYIPRINPITTTNGPAHRKAASPYNTIPQKQARSKKLSQESLLVHVSSPASWLRGRRKGCEYAKARVICGGVAMSNGDFWCTRIVERCLFADDACDKFNGEKAATVGGFGSLAPRVWESSSSFFNRVVEDMRSSHGVSFS